MRLLLLCLMMFGSVCAQNVPPARFPKPVMRSLILPGWGERGFNERERGLLFTGVETALWAFAGLSLLNERHLDDNLRYFAGRHAGVVAVDFKDEQFLDAIADYANMDDYNEQMLRNRRPTALYSADQDEYWEWDSEGNRLEYQDIKLDRYRWGKFLEYSFGAIALNHLISAIDVHYLQQAGEHVTLLPEIQPGRNGICLVITF